jgi:2-(acetamidomethylene)succinate hydrolase
VHRIDIGRIVLNVRDVGSGPPVIFLHGITSNSAVFEPLMHRLKGHFRCIAVDQRGHGLSDKPAAGYRARDYAEDIVALAASLKAGPVILVGHSLGARNSVEAAALAPEAVKCVVAIDFTPFIEDEVFDALEQRVNGGDRLFTSREDVEKYLHERYVLMPPEAVKCRAASAYRQVEGGFRPLASAEAMAATAKGLRESLEPAYRAVKRPVLLVRGALSKLVSAEALEKTRALRPDFPVIVVPNTDHYVNEEAPDVIAKAILDFARQADDHQMTPNAG